MFLIDKKFNYDDSENGKLFAAEFNALVDSLQALIEDTGDLAPTSNGGQVVKATDELIKHNLYFDIGTENNVILNRNKMVTDFETYVNDMYIIFKPKFTNTGPVKIQINNLPQKDLVELTGAMPAEALDPKRFYIAVYNEVNEVFIIHPLGSGEAVDQATYATVNTLSSLDPNTVDKMNVVTQHANCPDATSYWYIHTLFFGNPVDGMDRAQMAIEFSPADTSGSRIYTRTIKDDIAQPWLVSNNKSAEESLYGELLGGASAGYETLAGIVNQVGLVQTAIDDVNTSLANHANKNGDISETFSVANPVDKEDGFPLGFFNSYLTDNIQTSLSTDDPDYTQKALLVTQHVNCPGSSNHWYIISLFEDEPGIGLNKAQIAIEYDNIDPRIYVRSFYNSIKSDWTRLDSKEKDNILSGSFSMGYTRPETAMLGHIHYDQSTGAFYMYMKAGIGNIWIMLQEPGSTLVPYLPLDADGLVIQPYNTVSPIFQEGGQLPWVKAKISIFSNTNDFKESIVVNGESVPLDTVTPQTDQTFKSMCTGSSLVLVSFTNGLVYARGDNTEDFLGLGHDGILQYWTELPLKNIQFVAGQGNSFYAVNADNEVYVCGSNRDGQLGTGDKNMLNQWVKVFTSPSVGIRSIESNGRTTFIILDDGSVYVAGNGAISGMGLTITDSIVDWTLVTGLTDIVKISISSTHAIAMTLAGGVLTTGSNDYGELGDSTRTVFNTWANAYTTALGAPQIQDVVAGYHCTMALGIHSWVWACGLNDEQQLGTSVIVGQASDWTHVEEFDAYNIISFPKTSDYSNVYRHMLVNSEVTGGVIATNRANYDYLAPTARGTYLTDTLHYELVSEIAGPDGQYFIGMKFANALQPFGKLFFIGRNTGFIYQSHVSASTVYGKFVAWDATNDLFPIIANYKADYGPISFIPGVTEINTTVPGDLNGVEVHTLLYTE